MAAGEEIEAGPGDILIVPADTPHKFVSRGETHNQFSIHPVAEMETEGWSDPAQPAPFELPPELISPKLMPP